MPVGARFSTPVLTGLDVHPGSYTTYRVHFPGVKRPGRGVNRPSPSTTNVKERVELNLYAPPEPLWSLLRPTLPSTFI